MIPWLEVNEPFPPVEEALDTPNGLLAAGADLSADRLLSAYQQGIFPWYEDDQPLLWWSPNPRAVLTPNGLKVHRSLFKRLKNHEFQVFINRDFKSVIQACAAPRSYTDGTWITSEMTEAYLQLHQQGYAHSVECYQSDQLVGGLYGIGLGNLFFGESMFHHVTDASKVAFVHLARYAFSQGAPLIDCQLENQHLMSLGCELMPRRDFIHHLKDVKKSFQIDWQSKPLDYVWVKNDWVKNK